MNKIQIVALWLNQSGSVSALCQLHANNPLAMSTGNSSIARSCIHTFSMEKCEEMLGVSADELAGTDSKNSLDVSERNIDAEVVFNMQLEVQVLEAVGIESAIKKGILKRNPEGRVLYIAENQKKDRTTKQPVTYKGEPVFRKTRLMPKGTGDDRDSMDISPAPVNNLHTADSEDEPPQLF
jgi:hypothetical protein